MELAQTRKMLETVLKKAEVLTLADGRLIRFTQEVHELVMTTVPLRKARKK